MEIVVIIIMLMVGFNFVLKLTYHRLTGILVTCAVASLFIILVQGEATEQSKTQITDWLNQPELMLDTSVILTVDVFFQVTFCIMTAKLVAGERLTRIENIILLVTLWFPGLLIFPVLFAMLVEIIFSFTGTDFTTLAWCTAGIVMVLTPATCYAVRYILPEKDLRLELMFVINALTAILGVIATVNGRTAVKGTNTVEWTALTGVLLILAAGTAAGFLINRHRNAKAIEQL